MMELCYCYNEEKANTKMFLAALYLYCVKPLKEAKGTLYIAMDEDNRTFGNPECTEKMVAYLEHCLTGNIGKLDCELDETNIKLLQKLCTKFCLKRTNSANDPIHSSWKMQRRLSDGISDVSCIFSNRTF